VLSFATKSKFLLVVLVQKGGNVEKEKFCCTEPDTKFTTQNNENENENENQVFLSPQFCGTCQNECQKGRLRGMKPKNAGFVELAKKWRSLPGSCQNESLVRIL